MSNIIYYHQTSQSIESKLIQFFMRLTGMKRRMEKKIANNTYSKKPANLPKSFIRKFNIEVEEVGARKVWTLSPKHTENNTVILYLHGGAYYANITPMHWRLVEQLIISTNAIFIVPDYPLAPESTCTETYKFLEVVYACLTSKQPSKQIAFMGDSAGGGLALGFAQKISNESIKQPEQIILFSPWLDVSMTNPDITKYDKLDKILNVNGLKISGEKYAGNLGVTDSRVSPINGKLTNLGRISIFIGTNEVFIADARKLKQMLEEQQIAFTYLEFPEMFHDWVVVPNLKETKDVIKWITQLLN